MPKILVVEDEEILRNLYKELLEMKGYIVNTAEDGKRGLEFLENMRVDLILLDVNMPELDGEEFLKIIKSNDKLKKIPVLLITAISQIEKISKCLTMGAVGYIEKSSTPVEIMSKIEMVIGAFVETPGENTISINSKQQKVLGA